MPGKPPSTQISNNSTKASVRRDVGLLCCRVTAEVCGTTTDWLHQYNHQRPHEALGRIPLIKYCIKLFLNFYFCLSQEFKGTEIRRRNPCKGFHTLERFILCVDVNQQNVTICD
ncbi:integrase core domain-containing protein [Comamonas testosteroni]|uniref:integrase core domain-containing protein n=1 Tax=Comamonas testosteroni TaxID=285 RepID=UPI0012D7820E